MSDNVITVGEVEGEKVEAVKPIGNVQFLEWLIPRLKAGATRDQLYKDYCKVGDITNNSFSVKLSNVRKWARERGLVIPDIPRAPGGRTTEKFDVTEFAAKHNLEVILGDDNEE